MLCIRFYVTVIASKGDTQLYEPLFQWPVAIVAISSVQMLSALREA